MKHTTSLFGTLFLALFFAPAFALASTPVSGTLSADTTWTKADSPYVIGEDFVVPLGGTLTLNRFSAHDFTEDVLVTYGNSSSVVGKDILIERGCRHGGEAGEAYFRLDYEKQGTAPLFCRTYFVHFFSFGAERRLGQSKYFSDLYAD